MNTERMLMAVIGVALGVAGALVFTGTVIAINSVIKITQQPAPVIHIENSPIIIIGAESYQITSQEFAAIIDAVAGGDKFSPSSVDMISLVEPAQE